MMLHTFGSIHQGIYGQLYDFIPESFIMPNEYVKFCQRYSELKDNGEDPIWICKPSDLSRGMCAL